MALVYGSALRRCIEMDDLQGLATVASIPGEVLKSGVRGQDQLSLHLCLLQFPVSGRRLFQRKAVCAHWLQPACGQQGEKAGEIVAVPVRVLALHGTGVVERDMLPPWWQRPQPQPQVLRQDVPQRAGATVRRLVVAERDDGPAFARRAGR